MSTEPQRYRASQGLTIGADTAVSANTCQGLAFAYAQTNLDNDSRRACWAF